MRLKHYANIPIPIPTNIPPNIVLAYIQTFVPTLKHNICVNSFKEIPSDPNLPDDAIFGPWNNTVRTYEIHEITQLAPRISAQARWPVNFQCTPDGIRARAINSKVGTTVWATWTVRPRVNVASPANSESTNSSATVVGEEWELFDEVIIECHRLMMPFTAPYACKIHHDITQKIVDEITKGYCDGTLFQ
jgi:hypothetical protein